MIAFIEDHREVHRGEPIYRVLPIAPSTFYAHAAIARCTVERLMKAMEIQGVAWPKADHPHP